MTDQPKRNPIITTTSLPDGHAVLVNSTTSWAHTISPLAALVWEFCDGEHHQDDIVNELKKILNEERPGLAKEVSELLDQFADDGFIEE